MNTFYNKPEGWTWEEWFKTATAAVSTSIDVEAPNEIAARVLARTASKEGNVIWEYDGMIDGTMEIEDVTAA